MTSTGWIALGVLMLGGLLMFSRGGGAAGVDGATARNLVGAGARLVDVRTPEEYRERHLPDAVNIPLQVLGARMGDLGAKDKPIVLYCRSGARSGQASAMLRNAGFTAIHDLGSIANW